MATASLGKAFISTPSGKFNVAKNEYLIFIISATGYPSISPDTGGFPYPTLLTSIGSNSGVSFYIFGGLHTGNTGDVSYNVVPAQGGSSATVIYKVTPVSGEALSVVNTINKQSVSPGTSISISTTEDPKPGDVIFGGTMSRGTQGLVVDTDTTGGTWSVDTPATASYDLLYTTTGQYKNITASGSQTYNGTFTSNYVSSALVTVSAEQRTSYWGVRA